MYTAMLAFAKSAIVTHGATVANLSLYRLAILFVIECTKQILFPDGMENKREEDS